MGNPVVEELIKKTFQELSQPEKLAPRSRISNTPNGYIHLVAWANASLLRVLVHRFTDPLPKAHYRLKAQLDDAARSTVANIEEGFSRPTTTSYLDFLGYSYASLQEVKGDIQRSRQDNLLPSVAGSSIASFGINLRDWHEALKKTVISKPVNSSKGLYRNLEEFKGKNRDEPQHVYTAVAGPAGEPEGVYRNLRESTGKNDRSASSPMVQSSTPNRPLNSFTFLYSPVDNLRAQNLTHEVFIELVNKTDWHLRRLVVSLEDKLGRDQKFYDVEKSRLRSKIRFRR